MERPSRRRGARCRATRPLTVHGERLARAFIDIRTTGDLHHDRQIRWRNTHLKRPRFIGRTGRFGQIGAFRAIPLQIRSRLRHGCYWRPRYPKWPIVDQWRTHPHRQ